MAKQHMKLRNKQHRGPISPRVASPKQREHAFQRGKDAWIKFGKSITDCPYRSGLEAESWKKGYLLAANFAIKPVINKAPEGSEITDRMYGTVVVKRTGATRKLPAKQEIPRERPFNAYLGYIKPGKNGRLKRFYVWSNNPPEDKWRNKIADKSYKEEKDVEST